MFGAAKTKMKLQGNSMNLLIFEIPKKQTMLLYMVVFLKPREPVLRAHGSHIAMDISKSFIQVIATRINILLNQG